MPGSPPHTVTRSEPRAQSQAVSPEPRSSEGGSQGAVPPCQPARQRDQVFVADGRKCQGAGAAAEGPTQAAFCTSGSQPPTTPTSPCAAPAPSCFVSSCSRERQGLQGGGGEGVGRASRGHPTACPWLFKHPERLEKGRLQGKARLAPGRGDAGMRCHSSATGLSPATLPAHNSLREPKKRSPGPAREW